MSGDDKKGDDVESDEAEESAPSSADDDADEDSETESPEPEKPPEKQAKKPEKTARDKKAKKPKKVPAPPGLVSNRTAYGLAVLSGFLYFVAFPGIDVWPLAFVALAPMIVALKNQPPKRAFFIGWLAGFTMTMIGFYWLLEMLQTFSGFPLPLCLVFMAILCGYQSGRIGLLGWLAARGSARGWPFGAVFTLGFAASELVYPLLFPWTYAATVHQLPIFLQFAELGGPILVALTLVAANYAVAEVWIARLEKRKPRTRLIAILASVPVVSAIYGAIRISMIDAAVAKAPVARVGVVQANMSLLAKRQNRGEGLRRHVELTRELQKDGPLDLVVWSETSVMAPQEEDIAAIVYRSEFASTLGAPAIFGAVLVKRVPDVRRYVLFNSALLSDAEGNVVGRYDKQYLLAFGEYLPFGDTFPSMYEISKNSGKFTPGKTLMPLKFGSHEIATFICYEDIIPSFVNSIVKNGKPDLLVNITNDAWFGDSTEPWIHLALSKFRAIEHRRYFVRSTNSGVSAFIDPVGRVLAHTDPFQKQAKVHEVRWLRSWTPFGLWGELPFWLVAAASFGAAFVRRETLLRKE
jgi:apolipoprotein N-acyltransferase